MPFCCIWEVWFAVPEVEVKTFAPRASSLLSDLVRVHTGQGGTTVRVYFNTG
jgi:hypothetical protein